MISGVIISPRFHIFVKFCHFRVIFLRYLACTNSSYTKLIYFITIYVLICTNYVKNEGDNIKGYRKLKCDRCGHEWRSNESAKFPSCSQCGSRSWINTKNLSDEVKVAKMKDDVYSKLTIINQLDSYVNTLITINNKLVSEYESLKERVYLLENRSMASNPVKTKTIKEPNMSDAIKALKT